MKARLTALLLAVALGVSACAGGNTIPNIPTVQATTDKDVRASLSKAYGILLALGNLLDQSSTLEANVAANGGIPASLHTTLKQQFTATAKLGKALIQDLDSGAVKDWTTFQARVQPIINALNVLQQLTQPTGPSKWADILEGIVGLVITLLNPGALTGGVA